MVVERFRQIKNIRLGPSGFLLPYYNPAELANRLAQMDHLGQGRLNFGVAASGLPSDWAMFNVDGMSGENREMTRESLEIILRLWGDEDEFDHQGKYWHISKPAEMFGFLKPHLYLFQKPHPPDRRRRAFQGIGYAQAGWREGLYPDEFEPQSVLCW